MQKYIKLPFTLNSEWEKKIGKVKQLHMQMLAWTSSFTEKMIKHLESRQDLFFKAALYWNNAHRDTFAKRPKDRTLKLLYAIGLSLQLCATVTFW